LVHRHLRRPLAAAIAALAVLLVAAAPAGAANRRIAIGHYQWSDPNISVDLGEHVTWYWVGPDTMHSVTGTSVNDAGVDTDPGTNIPHHNIGDSFKYTFSSPGTYTFHCKLHPAVAGTITVSAVPGDPNTESDPVPRSNVDLKPPYLSDVHLDSSSFSKTGTRLHYSLNEAAKLDAEYYRLPKQGHRQFAGWRIWRKGHVGYNEVPFATRGRHFAPKPGRYEAVLRAKDASNNETRPQRVDFAIH
jgi:plastocyanin